MGWTDPVVLLGLLGGLAAAVAFVFVERRTEHPLLDVRIFSDRALAVSVFSLTVLLTWWARTILRVRRNRRAASVHPAAQSAPAESAADPDTESGPDSDPETDPDTESDS